tara:strand:+ start:733 stop:1131 length:399 start_codon:yes stop_codon:yes gene_type:complete
MTWKDILKQYDVSMREKAHIAAKKLHKAMKAAKPSNMVDGKKYPTVMPPTQESRYDALTDMVEDFAMNSKEEYGFGNKGGRGYLDKIDEYSGRYLVGGINREILSKIHPAFKEFGEATDTKFKFISDYASLR